MSQSPDVPAKIRSVWPPLLLGAMAVGFTYWAQDYGRGPRMLPTIVGGLTAFLCLLDILSRLDNRLGQFLRMTMGADFRRREMIHDPRLRDEAIQIGWMVSCILGMLFIGILPTVPIFIFGYMWLFGGRPWLASAISAVAVLGFVIIVFEVLLDYALYRGVLFDPKGFGAW